MENPLAQANPLSLDELFSLDPLSLTDDNIETIVAELRAQRERWQQSEAKGGKRKKIETVNLSLDDLGV